MYLFADTETTGLREDAAIAQMAMQLYDSSRKLVAEFSSPVKPEGWVMPEETAAFHGITHDFCEQYGIGIKSILALFNRWCEKAQMIICHNSRYDIGRLQYTMQRTGTQLYMPTKVFCTMEAARDIVKIPPTDKMVEAGMTCYKSPRLQEAYKFFFNEEFSGAHDAMADVRACARVFFALQDRENEAKNVTEGGRDND